LKAAIIPGTNRIENTHTSGEMKFTMMNFLKSAGGKAQKGPIHPDHCGIQGFGLRVA
jgi:hypothetical protein